VRLFGVTSLTLAGTWTDSRLTGEFADAHLHNDLAGLRAPTDTAVPVQCDRGPVCLSNHDEGGQGKEVPGVAKYTVQAGVNTILASKYLVTLNARVLGPYTPIGEPDVRTQPYVVFDLSGQVPLGTGLQLDVAIQNLFDSKYPEIRASGFINPGPPLTLRAAFNWSAPTH
jgi:outer membrane receptor protein involved in Fe transport